MEGGKGSTMSLMEPIGLCKVSNMLELMGRVVSTTLESSPRRSFRLHPADPEVGEDEQPHFQELWACGDFA